MNDVKKLFAKMNATIRQIYFEQDYDLYRRLATRPYFPLPENVDEFARKNGVRVQPLHEINPQFVYPLSEWNFTFPEVLIGKCPTTFSVYFAVSKICDVFLIQHYFELLDPAPDTPLACGCLDGTGHSEQPTTYLQAELEDEILKAMKKNGLSRLHIRDSKIVVPGLRNKSFEEYFPDSDAAEEFLQLNYWNLLFGDPMGLLN